MAENHTDSKEKPIHDGVSPIYVPEQAGDNVNGR